MKSRPMTGAKYDRYLLRRHFLQNNRTLILITWYTESNLLTESNLFPDGKTTLR